MKYEFMKAQKDKVKSKLADPNKSDMDKKQCEARKIREALSERGEAPGMLDDPTPEDELSPILEKVKGKYPNKKSPKISITISID
jgi:hypothetical protein